MMDRDLPAPQEFADAARAAIAACEGLGIRETAQRLAGDGLAGAIADEAVGGLGLPFDYAVPLLAAAGSSLLTFPLLETLVASRLLPDVAADIAAGKTVVTIAWNGELAVTGQGEALRVSGIIGNASRADECDFVIARLSDGGAALLPLKDTELHLLPGLDQERPLYQVTVADRLVPAVNLVSAEEWATAEADVWLGFAAICLGAAQTCLDMAQEHANTRAQFGKALSANQAMRHLLARQKLLLEGMRNVLDSCFLEQGTADLARRKAAFAAAAENAIAIIEKSIQVHGGMGFTWEVPLHRYLRWVRSIQAQGDVDAVLLSLADAVIGEQNSQAA
ncbi:MAG: acyl-CoA dehydrogenase family protein [Mesorhizobium sp.]